MLATARRGVANRCKLIRNSVLSLCCLLPSLYLNKPVQQNDAVLDNIHRRLTNVARLTSHKPIVFVVEITHSGLSFKASANPR